MLETLPDFARLCEQGHDIECHDNKKYNADTFDAFDRFFPEEKQKDDGKAYCNKDIVREKGDNLRNIVFKGEHIISLQGVPQGYRII